MSHRAHRRTAVRIAVGVDALHAELSLPTTRAGCWSVFFGDCPLPGDDALDRLAALAESWAHPPDRVVLIGAPAACLLPALWLRTIWLGPGTSLELHWLTVEPPGANPREQLAAQLCARLVNEVRCEDPESAAALWAIEPGPVEPAGPWIFDHILGLIDSWDIHARGAGDPQSSPWLVRTRAAFESCIDRGKTRIALYGAGTHTRALGPLLMEPRLDIACIIDDNPAIHGVKLWGYPVVSRERALEMSLQAVVLSANSHEDKLWERARPLREAGIEVIRLYTAEAPGDGPPGAEPKPARIAPGAKSPLSVSTADALTPPRLAPVLGALAIQPGVSGFWADLDTALRQAGSALYAVVAHSEVPTPPLTSVFGSFGAAAQLSKIWPRNAPLGPEPDRELYQRCLSYDRFYWRTAPDLEQLTLRGVRAATWLFDHAVRCLRPGLGLVLNGDASAFAVAEHVFRSHGVPILYCERGAFNPSVVFDRLGVEGRMVCELTDDPVRRRRLSEAATGAETETGRRLGAYLAAKRPQNWQSTPRATPRPAVDSARVIAWFPSYEPTADARERRSTPTERMPFGNSLHAAQTLCESAASLGPDVRIVLKPHPRDPDRHLYRLLAEHHGQVFADELTIFDAAEAGWTVATTSASVAWMATALGCRVLTLARHACGTAGSAFAPVSGDELWRDLRSALAGEGCEARADRGRAIAARYATEYCFTSEPDLRTLGVPGPTHAAECLLSAAAPVAHAGSPATWLEELAANGLIPEPASAVAGAIPALAK